MKPTEHAIQSLLAAIARRNARFLDQVANAPREQPCAKHPHTLEILNTEATAEQSKLVYICAACEADAYRTEFGKIQTNIGIPYDVRHATIQNFKPGVPEKGSVPPKDFVAAALDMLHGNVRTLILAGTCGIGKGHLAAAILNEMIARRAIRPWGKQSAKWVTAHNLFDAIHRSYHTAPGAEPVIRFYGSRGVLVLDECALDPLPKDGQRTLYDIFDQRQKTPGCYSILLTNNTASNLKAWLGEPLVDRLRTGGLRFLWGSWPSARGTEIDQAGKPNDF